MLFIKPIKLYASIISVWIAGMLHYPACAQGNLFNQDSLKLILKDFEFTEGPAVDKKEMYFLQTSRIIRSGNTVLTEKFPYSWIKLVVLMVYTLINAVI